MSTGLPPPRPMAAPAQYLWLWELRVVPEVVASLIPRPLAPRLPRGSGQPVLVLPGYGANDTAMLLMVRRLRKLGFRAVSWGLGRNHGDLRTLVPKVSELVQAMSQRTGQKVMLVGWSLGGTISREVARDNPMLVARVITLGSPVVGGPKYTFVAHAYKKRGYDLDRIEESVAKRDAVPLRVPVTAFYDRHDAIVSWPACIDRKNSGVEHIEVKCSHFGMAFDRKVFALIAQALAAR
jgi:pimeloyl-ACP methyl ester carboxylesterase